MFSYTRNQGGIMTEWTEAQCAVVAATRRELGRIAEEQQRLADDLARGRGAQASDDAIRRMQAV